jgi:hypothetical protein
MKPIDRRALTRGLLSRAAVAAAGLAIARTVSAMPLEDRVPGVLDNWIAKAQVVVTRPPPRRHWRRRRVWRCWWRRGRRVCGWVWV